MPKVIIAAILALASCGQPNNSDTAASKNVEGAIPKAQALGSEDRVSPSFDCSRASTHVENLICSEPPLAAKDAAMAILFESATPDDDVRTEQRKWLSARNQCGDSNCLAQSYDDRLMDLGMLVAGQYSASKIAKPLVRDDGEGWLQIRPLGRGWFLFTIAATWNHSHEGWAAGVFELEGKSGTWRENSECSLDFRRENSIWEVKRLGDCSDLGGVNVSLEGRYQ